MFPNVLRQQPFDTRQLDPLDTFNVPSFAPFGNGLQTSIPQHASQGQSSQVPRSVQYPFSANRPLAHLSHESTHLNTPRSFNAGEHTLRRKTPNGTLAAGYDGTPVDRTLQPHPAKQIIVSTPDSTHVFSNATQANDSWQKNTYEQLPERPHHKRFPSAFKYNATTSAITAGGFPQNTAAGNWMHSFNYVPGMDSVLHQTPFQPMHRFYLQNGQQIPTVLPATLQSVCLGPTASMETGPYGPYWPDGVYIPYRPAAMRDSRFHPNLAWNGNHGSLQTGLGDIYCPAFNGSSIPSTDFLSFPHTGLDHLDYSKSQAIHDSLMTMDPFRPKFPSRHAVQVDEAIDMYDQHAALAFPSQPNYVDSGTSMDEMNHDLQGWIELAQQTHQAPTADIRARSGNAEFKEKVLSWAHSVYVDLLATLHQSRKNAQKGQHESHLSSSSKLNIYPKPPRQPGSDFSSREDATAPTRNQPNLAASSQVSQFAKQARDSDRNIRRHSDQDTRMLQNFPVSSHPYQGHYDPYGQPGQVPHHRLNSTDPNERLRLLRRSSGPNTLRVVSPQQSELAIKTNAKSSLEMLSTLCQESNWQWIDGMLLGGCLAYGLGDYNKAMRWYTRILNKDET
jgi:hypothetical protein